MPTQLRYLLAAILLALVVVLPAAAQPSTPPANPEPTTIELKPASKTITVTVPANATFEQRHALIKAAAPQNELVRIHLVIDKTLAPKPAITTAEANPIAASHAVSYTMQWNRPVFNNYSSATPEDLSPTLTFNVYTDTVGLSLYSWINYKNIERGESEFYVDFDFVNVTVTGSGSIQLHLPTYTPKAGYEQDAQFNAYLGEYTTNGWLKQSTIHFYSHVKHIYSPVALS